MIETVLTQEGHLWLELSVISKHAALFRCVTVPGLLFTSRMVSTHSHSLCSHCEPLFLLGGSVRVYRHVWVSDQLSASLSMLEKPSKFPLQLFVCFCKGIQQEFSKKSRGYLYTPMYDSASLIGTGQWWMDSPHSYISSLHLGGKNGNMADFTWLNVIWLKKKKKNWASVTPLKELCINYVNIQVVSLAMATGCGKHDHSPYAYPDRARRMILQFKPHFLLEMRINGSHTHAWGPEGLHASFLNTGKDRLDWAVAANNGKSASYLLSSGFPSIRSLIPLQYFSVGNFATNSIPYESVLRWH